MLTSRIRVGRPFTNASTLAAQLSRRPAGWTSVQHRHGHVAHQHRPLDRSRKTHRLRAGRFVGRHRVGIADHDRGSERIARPACRAGRPDTRRSSRQSAGRTAGHAFRQQPFVCSRAGQDRILRPRASRRSPTPSLRSGSATRTRGFSCIARGHSALSVPARNIGNFTRARPCSPRKSQSPRKKRNHAGNANQIAPDQTRT